MCVCFAFQQSWASQIIVGQTIAGWSETCSGRTSKSDMWIKICGITRVEDGRTVLDAQASAMGLNFYRGSKRFVSVEQATLIANAVREHGREQRPLDVVGVFVNAPVSEVAEIARAVSLTAVQFHGDESPSQIAEFNQRVPEVLIIRAMRISVDRLEECLEAVDSLSREVPLAACLLDAFVPGEFGGTGMTLSPDVLHAYLAKPRPRLILAGGLTSENVTGILQVTQPWGVDTASGVERTPGIKDADKIRAFVKGASSGAGEYL